MVRGLLVRPSALGIAFHPAPKIGQPFRRIFRVLAPTLRAEFLAPLLCFHATFRADAFGVPAVRLAGALPQALAVLGVLSRPLQSPKF